MLFNPRLQRVYRVREGIPVMLIDEAQRLEPSEAERLDRPRRGRGDPPDVFTMRLPTDHDEEDS